MLHGREKKESTVEFVRKAVNRLSYDGLTKFDSTSYKDLNTQFGFNRVHKIKKIEDIVFGENREGKYYGVNYYKKGIDEEERRKRLSERAMEEEIERTQEKFRKR